MLLDYISHELPVEVVNMWYVLGIPLIPLIIIPEIITASMITISVIITRIFVTLVPTVQPFDLSC